MLFRVYLLLSPPLLSIFWLNAEKIGMTGFEPATSTSRTALRHSLEMRNFLSLKHFGKSTNSLNFINSNVFLLILCRYRANKFSNVMARQPEIQPPVIRRSAIECCASGD